MPLVEATLLQGLVSLDTFSSNLATAAGWARVYGTYARTAVPLLPLPTSADTAATATLLPILADPTIPFATLLETAISAFWRTAIPLGTPGCSGVVTPSGLRYALAAPMAAAVGCISRPAALGPIAAVIHQWARTVVYLPPGGPPILSLS